MNIETTPKTITYRLEQREGTNDTYNCKNCQYYITAGVCVIRKIFLNPFWTCGHWKDPNGIICKESSLLAWLWKGYLLRKKAKK